MYTSKKFFGVILNLAKLKKLEAFEVDLDNCEFSLVADNYASIIEIVEKLGLSKVNSATGVFSWGNSYMYKNEFIVVKVETYSHRDVLKVRVW